MTADHPDDQALPYVELTNETYAEHAAEKFTIEEPEPGTMVLRGPCPRCQAVIEIPVVDSIFRSTRSGRFWRRRPLGTDAKVHVEPMMCTCEGEHRNRPEGLVGCGAYWTLTISTPAP